MLTLVITILIHLHYIMISISVAMRTEKEVVMRTDPIGIMTVTRKRLNWKPDDIGLIAGAASCESQNYEDQKQSYCRLIR